MGYNAREFNRKYGYMLFAAQGAAFGGLLGQPWIGAGIGAALGKGYLTWGQRNHKK